MRERSTWNRTDIARRAASRMAAEPADIHSMNHPEHARQQPAPDAYSIGGPSEFAEDVNTENRWEDEYSGGQVKRNEIGLPEFRPDTNEAMVMKAATCLRVAHLLLPNAPVADIEKQAFSLMHLPNADLVETLSRVSKECDEDEDEDDDSGKPWEKEAQKDDEDEDEDDDSGKPWEKEAVAKAVEALASGNLKKATAALTAALTAVAQQAQKDQGQKDQGQKDQGQEKQAQGQAQQDQGQQAQGKQAQQDQGQKDQAQGKQAQQAQAQQDQGQKDQGKQAQQAQAQQDQGQEKQAALQEEVRVLSAKLAQLTQQLNQQVPGMAPQAQAQAQDMDLGLIDDVLSEPGQESLDIDFSGEDDSLGEVCLGEEDDILKTLYASDDQDEDQGLEQKQASVRTASVKTVGTRANGVNRIGGAVGPSGSEPNLSSLWSSAPDISQAFGLK